MLIQTVLLTLLPALSLAAPSADVSARQDELKTCCFTTSVSALKWKFSGSDIRIDIHFLPKNINKPIFITTGDGDFLDTLKWCFLNVKR